MKEIKWSEEKNQILQLTRGLSFEMVLEALENGEIIDIKEHPNKQKYPNQKIFVLKLNDYLCYVPFVENGNEIFLKIIIPSRKLKRSMKMKKDEFLYDLEELEIIENIESAKSVLKSEDKEKYAKLAKYTKSLHTKKPVTIRFSVTDLAAIKAKAKELGIGYQNLIQALVHQFANGKIKLEL